MHKLIAMFAAAAVLFGTAHAAELHYTASLAGNQYPTETGSAATGQATLVIDTTTQTIDATITISGITFDQLAHHLAHSRMGPIHLHRYQGDDVTLIMPFPFNATYAETADGFTVTIVDYPYADAAQAVRSELNFDEFVAALGTDPIYLNVHTNAFGDGEIAGRVSAAAH
ncbi:MAG: CHRD domain-containing protein [Hyphomonadaceae bacterium]